jgi:hypothetical protein
VFRFTQLTAILLLAATARAGVIVTGGATNGTTVSVPGVTDSVTGATMAGMQITGTFAGNITLTCSWTAAVGNAGICGSSGSGADFLVSLNGDTLTAPWNLTVSGSLNLLSLLINSNDSAILFDRLLASNLNPIGTPGSSLGTDAAGTTTPLLRAVNGRATYQNIVALGSNPARGDLYNRVQLAFSGAGLAPSQSASWLMDADRSTIPEPANWAMLGVGLCALGALKLRRQKHNL